MHSSPRSPLSQHDNTTLLREIHESKRTFETINSTSMLYTSSFRTDGDPIQFPKKKKKQKRNRTKNNNVVAAADQCKQKSNTECEETEAIPDQRNIDSYLSFYKSDKQATWKCGLDENYLTSLFTNMDLFRQSLLSTVDGLKLSNSLSELLGPDEVRKLWETEI
jgi:hypothetical protein